MKTVEIEMSRKNLALFQFLLEGYGRVAAMTTIDAHIARVRITIMPDFKEEVFEIIAQIAKIAACRRIS